MIQRLAPTNQMRAKNYTADQARIRIPYYAKPLTEQYNNSIAVNGSHCIYFQKVGHGHTCTCVAQTVTDNVQSNIITNETSIDIDLNVPLFGGQKTDHDTFIELNTNNVPDSNGTESFIPSLFGNSIDCGICFRTGYVPGYTALGYSRQVLTTHNVLSIDGYEIKNTMPAQFIRLRDDAQCTFSILVPPTYKAAAYRVFNNREPLTDEISINLVPGRQLLHVSSSIFTHIVVMFEIGKHVLIDFPQDQKSLDLTLFDSIGTVQLVAANNIPNVSSGDLIYNIELDRLLKVTDFTYFRLKTGQVLGWNITARPVQKDETVFNIHQMIGI